MITFLKRLVSTAIAILIIIFVVYKLAWSQPYQEEKITDTSIHFNQISLSEGVINYVFSGDSENKLGVLFIHGTPGGWAAYERYLTNQQLQSDFFMVSVDRPGWGKSATINKDLNGDFSHQAQSIAEIFKHHHQKKWIVVGHSLGASLAPKVALQAPDSVSALVLLAGSLNPRLGKPRWYNHAASTWIISKMIGKKMTRSNREIMKLNKQLLIMDTEIKATKLPVDVTVIQGLKDKLVSPKNPQYVLNEWRDNFKSLDVIELPNAGHFLPWQEDQKIITTIKSLAIKSQQ